MLEHLRQQVSATLASARMIVLANAGPAGLQAQALPCTSISTTLYVRVLHTSDLLLNIEQQPDMLAIAANWQLRGRAQVLPVGAIPADLALPADPLAEWSQLIELRGVQLILMPTEGEGQYETIDIW